MDNRLWPIFTPSKKIRSRIRCSERRKPCRKFEQSQNVCMEISLLSTSISAYWDTNWKTKKFRLQFRRRMLIRLLKIRCSFRHRNSIRYWFLCRKKSKYVGFRRGILRRKYINPHRMLSRKISLSNSILLFAWTLAKACSRLVVLNYWIEQLWLYVESINYSINRQFYPIT